ncbi:hypothetical protein DYB36_005850 [Aphanomyces astaci]|uniref:EF-hand domain-containing protein n=1 Tax=Aphanomyces astaci TaxID=112090 RepID=A0A397BAG9_APHAT|nr:hypothetical protein DYB36_005850 [Aphanomyces astaci]
MARPEGADTVGWRVQVLWEDEGAWFEGVVTEYEDQRGYYVCYDDGDEKWQPTSDAGSVKFMSNTIGQSVEARVSSIVTPPATSRQDSQRHGIDAVGWRVQVFWADEGAWFDGAVTDFNESMGYFVCYDDGETKWQVSNDSSSMVFVSSCGTIPEKPVETAVISPCVKEPSSPTKTEYGDDDFEHQDDTGDSSVQPVQVEKEAKINSPRPIEPTQSTNEEHPFPTLVDVHDRLPSADRTNEAAFHDKLQPTMASSTRDDDHDTTTTSTPTLEPYQVKSSTTVKPAKPRRNNPGVFFHDKETLLEMKTKLTAKKKALDDHLRQLQLKVTTAEIAEAAQKQEVADLTAKLTVEQLTTTRRVAPPKQVSNEERVLDLTVKTRQMKKDNQKLRASVGEATTRVGVLKEKLDAARAEWHALPAQCRTSVGEIETQIALLQAQKEALIANQRHDTVASISDQLSDSALALKQQLADSDSKVWKLKAELHHWKGLVEQERAKVDAMQAHLTSLQSDMRPFRSSKLLLRSAFDRCDKDKSGDLTVNETIQMLLLLASPDDGVSEQDMRSHFAQTDANHDHRIDFDEFCAAVDRLFSNSGAT